MPQTAQANSSGSRRQERSSYTLDDGISSSCISTAQRNGFPRRIADGCQINPKKGGGSVGCPDCPYKPSPPTRARFQ